MSWFKFTKKPSKEERMEDHRADLIHRRVRLEEDVSTLETREDDILRQGKSATSNLQKRRLAAQLNQLRKDTARHRQSIAMFNQQINVHATDLHNKEIIDTAQAAQLPSTDELTSNAVKAEEILETLAAESEMVSEFETVQCDISDEELAIMAEFDEKPEEAEKAEPKVLKVGDGHLCDYAGDGHVDDYGIVEDESLHTDKYPVNRTLEEIKELRE